MRTSSTMALALLAAGCASAPPRKAPPPSATSDGCEVIAVRVSVPPMVDGIANDPAWSLAQETEIPLRKESGKDQIVCHLKSVVHQGTFYLMVKWEDPTEDRRCTSVASQLRNTHLNVSGPPDLPAEDAVEMMWNMNQSGPATVSPVWEETKDAWLWSSFGTDPSGRAWDGMLVTREAVSSELHRIGVHTLPDGRVVRTLTFQDGTDDSGGRIEGVNSPPYHGDAGNVASRAEWREGRWTLEMARALSTGSPHDLDLSETSKASMQFIVYDQSLFWTSRKSPVVRLLLPPPVPEDKQGPFPEPRGGPRERR